MRTITFSEESTDDLGQWLLRLPAMRYCKHPVAWNQEVRYAGASSNLAVVVSFAVGGLSLRAPRFFFAAGCATVCLLIREGWRTGLARRALSLSPPTQ